MAKPKTLPAVLLAQKQGPDERLELAAALNLELQNVLNCYAPDVRLAASLTEAAYSAAHLGFTMSQFQLAAGLALNAAQKLLKEKPRA